MSGTGGWVLAALGVGLGLALAPAARAECPADMLQTVVDRFAALSDTSQAVKPISDGVLADAAACMDDPFVLKVATLSQVSAAVRTQTEPAVALGHAGEALRLYMAMIRVMPKTESSRTIVLGGAQQPLRLNDTSQVAKQVLNTLFTLEKAAGAVSAHNPPPKPGDPPIPCDVYTTSLTQEAGVWMRQNGETPGAAAFFDRLVANCTGNEFNRLVVRAHRVSALVRLAQANPASPAAADMIRRAYADHEAIIAQNPQGLAIYWRGADFQMLDNTAWSVAVAEGFDLPVEKWFASETLGDPLAAPAIAAKLDAAYAADLAAGGDAARLFKSYRALLQDGYARVRQLPEPQQREGRKLLHKAAKGHADGVWRRRENAGLRKPYEWLYNWIDPDFVPPPAPGSAPASAP